MSSAEFGPSGGIVGEMTPTHARKTSRTPGLGAAWAVLVGTGATSVTYNVVHATQGARLEIALALLLGFMPAFIAACLSHVAAVLHAPRWVIAAVIAVMGAGMVLSASATASVVAPADPSWRGWLFGGTLDAGALLALWAIMASRRRKNEVGAAAAAAETKAQNATAEAARAATERDAARAETDAVKAQLSAELTALRSELATANGALQALRDAAHKPRPKRAKSVAPRARTSADTQDLTTELRAMQMLDAHPELRAKGQGAELARRLGVHPSTGRRLLAQLTSEERPSEGAHERAHERPADTAHERSSERAHEQSQDR